LSWSASNSANVNGYNVYRATSSGGPYAKLNTSLVGGTGYVSSNVASGQTYYYVATAVNSSNSESGYSPEAAVKIPTP
jgi:fibronectin type 3 domain-containing protein